MTEPKYQCTSDASDKPTAQPYFAIVGAGPSGLFTAQALRRSVPKAVIDIIDMLPVPFGLIRYGVAPDHQGTKNIVRQFERLFEREDAAFFGNVMVGSKELSLQTLSQFYDAVVLATGLSEDKRLGIPGESLPGVYGSGAVTRWFSSHPLEKSVPHFGNSVIIIGQGNVAIDVARLLGKRPEELETSDMDPDRISILDKMEIREIEIVGRGRPEAIKFDSVMARELATLRDARIEVHWPSDLRHAPANPESAVISALRQIDGTTNGNASRLIRFRFGLIPREIIASHDMPGRVSAVRFNQAGTERDLVIPTKSLVTAIGYCENSNDRSGQITPIGSDRENIYVTGWLRRGSRGVIPDCRTEAKELAAVIAARHTGSGSKPGRAALQAHLIKFGARVVDYKGWLCIRSAEECGTTSQRPRIKPKSIQEMLSLANLSNGAARESFVTLTK